MTSYSGNPFLCPFYGPRRLVTYYKSINMDARLSKRFIAQALDYQDAGKINQAWWNFSLAQSKGLVLQ